MALLLENDCLIFSKEDLLEEEILRCRSVKNFRRDYLNKATVEKIKVYRILDSQVLIKSELKSSILLLRQK